MKKRRYSLPVALLWMSAVFLALCIALAGALSLAPDDFVLHSRLALALVSWCLPTIYVAYRASRNATQYRLTASPAGAALAAALLLAVMLGSFLWTYRAQFRGALFTRPQDFRQTSGTIAIAELVYQPGGGKSGPSWRYHVIYDYTVAGARYSSSLVNFDWVQADANRAIEAAFVQRFPPGSRVTVFYLPGNPNFAVLQPQEKGSTIYFCGALLLINACCLVTAGRAGQALLRAHKESD